MAIFEELKILHEFRVQGVENTEMFGLVSSAFILNIGQWKRALFNILHLHKTEL